MDTRLDAGRRQLNPFRVLFTCVVTALLVLVGIVALAAAADIVVCSPGETEWLCQGGD